MIEQEIKWANKLQQVLGDEYRGHEYMITDEHNGYSEPLWVKHRNEQERIDREIEDAEKPIKEWQYKGSAQEGFDVFWEYVNQ